MIDRQYGQMNLVCDNCGEWQGDNYEYHDFDRMIREAKDEGWRVKSGRGEWEHYCPACTPAAMDFE